MAKDINYEKRNNYRYTSYKSKVNNHAHHMNALSKPTQEMIRFNKFLVKLCHENGINDVFEYTREDRNELYQLNDTLSRKLTMAGVQYKELWRSQKKFRFDKDGNVVDAWTGKIIKRRAKE